VLKKMLGTRGKVERESESERERGGGHEQEAERSGG